MPLSDYQRRRIVSLWTQSGKEMTFTRMETILAMEKIITTRQTIKATFIRWQKTGSVRDFPTTGPPQKVPELYYCCIDEGMTKNDKLTASDFKDILSKKLVQRRCSIVSEQLQDFEMVLAEPTVRQKIFAAKNFGEFCE